MCFNSLVVNAVYLRPIRRPGGTTFVLTKRRTEFGSQPRFESAVCFLLMLSLDQDVIEDRVYSFVLFLRNDLNSNNLSRTIVSSQWYTCPTPCCWQQSRAFEPCPSSHQCCNLGVRFLAWAENRSCSSLKGNHCTVSCPVSFMFYPEEKAHIILPPPWNN